MPPFADDAASHVVSETPQGRRNKFNYDAELGRFRLGGVLPAEAVFPFDFGFVPGTRGQDGDLRAVLACALPSA
ncbi:MAG: inorganic diphosphatase [Chloroflexota bacterium]|nr:inorganic diphosphatase [Chloroflexota bacterium]